MRVGNGGLVGRGLCLSLDRWSEEVGSFCIKVWYGLCLHETVKYRFLAYTLLSNFLVFHEFFDRNVFLAVFFCPFSFVLESS